MTNLEDGVTAGTEIDESQGGTIEIEGQEQLEVTEPEPTYDYLDVEDTSSKYVKVKVDGEELSVPLREALDGYQRQADYTRGKQTLAEQRREADEALQVYSALRSNPGLTMQVLANRAGVSVEEYLGMAQNFQQPGPPPEEEYADPLERQLVETQRQVEALQGQIADQQADQMLRQVMDGLKATFSIDEDEARAVVAQTQRMGLGIQAIPLVYRAMAFEQGRVRDQAAADAATQRETNEQQRRAAAAAATAAVATGASPNGVTEVPPARTPTSIRDAIEQAFDEVEARSARR